MSLENKAMNKNMNNPETPNNNPETPNNNEVIETSNVENIVSQGQEEIKTAVEGVKEENKEIIKSIENKEGLDEEDLEKAQEVTEEAGQKVEEVERKTDKEVQEVVDLDKKIEQAKKTINELKEEIRSGEKNLGLDGITEEDLINKEKKIKKAEDLKEEFERRKNLVENFNTETLKENEVLLNLENTEGEQEKENKDEFTEDNILSLFSERNIKKDDLDKISGFSELDLSAKKIVFDLFDKVCLEKIKSNVFQEESKRISSKKSKLGKMGMAFKNIATHKKREQKTKDEVLGAGFTPEAEQELNNLVKTFNNTEIKSEISPKGEVIFDFVDIEEKDKENIRIAENKDVVEELNDSANVLANMPKHKKYESKKNRIKYEKAQKEYEKGKKELEATLKSLGKTDEEVMKTLLTMDTKVNSMQFLTDYPDLEEEWKKMSEGKIKGIFRGMKNIDKAAFFVGGAAARRGMLLGVGAVAGAGSLASFAAIPLVGGIVGGVRGINKGKKDITKTEKNIDKKSHWKDSNVFKDKELAREEYVKFYKNNNIEELLNKQKEEKEVKVETENKESIKLSKKEKQLLEKKEELYLDWKKKEKIEEEAPKKGNNKTRNKRINQTKKAKEEYESFYNKNNIKEIENKQKEQESKILIEQENKLLLEKEQQILEENEKLVLNLKSMDEAIFEFKDQDNKKIERSTLRAQDLTGKLDYLVENIKNEKNKKNKDDEKISDYLNSLKRRIEFTQKKSEKNLVNFGSSKENLNNNINFFKKLAEAHMFLADNIAGMKEGQNYKIEKKEKDAEGEYLESVSFVEVNERAEKLLNYIEESQGKKLSQERKKYIKKAVVRGAKNGAIFSALGSVCMDAVQGDGVFQSISEAVSSEGVIGSDELYKPVENVTEVLGREITVKSPLIQKNIELLQDLNIPSNVPIDDNLIEIINDPDLPFKEDILSSENLINNYDEIKDWPEEVLKNMGETGEITDKHRGLVEFFNNNNDLTISEQEVIFDSNVNSNEEARELLGELRAVTEEIKQGSNFTEALRDVLKNCNDETKDAFLRNVDSQYNIFSEDVILSDENREILLKKAVNRLSVEGANPDSGVANLVYEGNILKINSETGAWDIIQGSSEFEPQAAELTDLSSEVEPEIGGDDEVLVDTSDEVSGVEDLSSTISESEIGGDEDLAANITEEPSSLEDIEDSDELIKGEEMLKGESKEERDLIVSEMIKNVDGYEEANIADKENMKKMVVAMYDNSDEDAKDLLKKDMLKLKYPGLDPDMAEVMFRTEVISKAIPSIGDDMFCIKDIEIIEPHTEYSISGKSFCLADRLDEITKIDDFFDNLTERDQNKLVKLIDDIRERDTFNPAKHGRKLEKFLISAYKEYK